MNNHYNNYPVWRVISVVAVILWLFDAQHTSIVHVFWCPRQTQHLRPETSFRPEDHTDWEIAPPSYNLQSWFEWPFENYLPPWTTLSNCPSANNLSAVLKTLSKVSKIWTSFPSSEIRKQVGQVWELRDLKPVPLQKAARIGNFALVNPKGSLCSARTRRAKVDLAFIQTQPQPPHLTDAGELLRIHHNIHAFSYSRTNNASARF